MDFMERMRDVMGQGFETTKKGLEQAAGKARELGEKGVLKYEITRLEKEVERKLGLLGSETYRLLVEKGQSSITKGSADIKPIISEIQDLEKRITEKEKAMAEVGHE
jgi:hypothetical protein